MPLTDTACRQAKPKAKPYKLADAGGLYLLVNSTGKYWRWDYRHAQKRKTMSFGVYPDVPLAEARERHQSGRRLLATGQDPMTSRKEAKQADAITFEGVARRWWAHWAPSRSPRHAEQVLRRLEMDVFPEIGNVPIAQTVSSAFRDMAKKIESRGAIDIAKRALQTCGQVMRYAVAHDLTERNPVSDIRPGDFLKVRKKRNYSRVSAQELPELLRAIEQYTGNEHTRLALQLMALTFVRTSELIQATWDEIDFVNERWNIPADRTKMKTPHIVPLSKQTLAVFEELKRLSLGRNYIFPGDLDPKKSMSNNTILYALYRMGYRGRMTGHGFRGVASTILHEQGWPHAHIELQLAHQERNDVSAAYNHAQYLQPRKMMMQAWADHLDAVKHPNVVPMTKHA